MHTALSSAEQHLRQVLLGQCEELRLEEIELSDDDRYWFVTLSYHDTRETIPRRRHYKTIKLDAGNGQFRAMKDRSLNVVA